MENRNRLLGIMLLLNRVRMCVHVLSIISGRTDTAVCTDMDLLDKGHLCFVYFAEATVFVGCVQQSISSFNGLKSKKS